METVGKFLAVKNWEKYQSVMRNGSTVQAWIKLHTNRCDDREFSSLSFFQRCLLTELWCLRARLGKNIHNDVTYISRAIHALGTDRPHIGHALGTLIVRGFLVLTNDELSSPEERRGEDIKRGEEKRECLGRRQEDRFQPTEDSDVVIEQVVKLHPKNWRVNGQITIPLVQSEAVARAIARDGPELVRQGTARYAEAVKKWPEHERRFIRDPVRFWNESDYLRDPKEWETTKDVKDDYIGRVAERMAAKATGDT